MAAWALVWNMACPTTAEERSTQLPSSSSGSCGISRSGVGLHPHMVGALFLNADEEAPGSATKPVMTSQVYLMRFKL